MKRKGRAISVLAVIFLSVAGLILICLLGLYIYSRFAIDFDGDVMLFDRSRAFESTTFFADADKTDSEYTSVELEISGSLKKIHYSLDEISPYLKNGFIAVFFMELSLVTQLPRVQFPQLHPPRLSGDV